jgi:hypothetical protein
MKTPEWYAEDLRRHHEEMKRTSIGIREDLKKSNERFAKMKQESVEARKRILAHVAQRKAAQAAESLKNANHIQAPKAIPQEASVEKPTTSKRKKQLDELLMLKKEVENSKITDIKLDSRIEGMIIKLDALTKSKVLRKQIKDLLEEIEEFKEFKVDGITGSEEIPKLIKKVEAQIKKTKNKKVVEELKALKKQVEETEFKELKEAKSYKEKYPESKAVKMAECPCEDSKEDLKACKKEVASLMRKLKKYTK